MPEDQIVELLEACPLFRGMNRDEISVAFGGRLGRIRHYPNGVLIAQAGEEVGSLHILLQGSVKGEMMDYTGKVIKIEDIYPVRPLAPAFLFGRQNSYPVNITSGEDALVLSVPREGFLLILQQSEKILVNFIDIVSSRGQFLSNKIKFLSFTSIKGKLAQYLLDLHTRAASSTFLLPHSQSQLSELFGVARPSIGRALVELKREGIIHSSGKQVEIRDFDRLTSYLK